MDNTPATMFNRQVRPHGLSIYSQHGFILIMDALGTKRITDKMDPGDCYNRWEKVIAFINETIESSSFVNTFDIYSFSDTLIVTIDLSNRDVTNTISELGPILRHIIKECYLIEVVLRGSLSIGAFFKSH